MQSLPQSFAPLGAYRQFLAYRLVPSVSRPGKTDKFPLDAAGRVVGASDPAALCDFDEARQRAATHGHGVGFTLTDADPFFFLDVDGALDDSGAWSPTAVEICGMFPNAAVEISQSGRGLHVIGSGVCPPHGCRNGPLGLELYTSQRFVALTGSGVRGSAAADCSAALSAIVPRWFPEPVGAGADWTDGPVRDGVGIADDAELLERAMKSRSAGAAFGSRASFADLWTCDTDALAAAYPDPDRPFDASAADAALAQHLAFWTGGDCERVSRLMRESGLSRDKYEREDYLPRTVGRACSLQTVYYGSDRTPDSPAPETPNAVALTGSAKEKEWAEKIRAGILSAVTDPADRDRLAAKRSAKFWIDRRGQTAEQIAASIRPMETAVKVIVDEVEQREGMQYMSATMQREHFAGCVYTQSRDEILVPSGAWLDKSRFNSTYGGYEFQLSDDKTTKTAWDAFTQSQSLRWPIAEDSCFRPDLPFAAFVELEGRRHVNVYREIPIRRVAGDPAPFLEQMRRLLPNDRDRLIALSYAAACVQYKGVKFQWCPLFQGTFGNGKSLITRCVVYALGRRYCHLPEATNLDKQFNLYLSNKLLIGLEDVYVPRQKIEVIEKLKPMITGEWREIEGKGANQEMQEICANFILNSNHRDALGPAVEDRRYAVFFTAQQTAADLVRDGMGGDYFPELYDWLKGAGRWKPHGENYGYAIVADYLDRFEIPAELNPAGLCSRAPVTSTTAEAVEASLGGVEQEILEAIEEGRPGFRDGWLSSMALDRLLQSMRMARAVPPNRRRELLRSLGYDWHPALKDGRAPSVVPMDGGKPRIFIRIGQGDAAARPVDVLEAYQRAQGVETFSPAGIGAA